MLSPTVWSRRIRVPDPVASGSLDHLHRIGGFFVPERAQPDKLDDRELADSWYSPDNFDRQARCFHLAEQKSVQPVSVALAYVLHQPFPVFPLIGPRQIAETVTSFEALDVSLTDRELSWLNLEVEALE